ncbi:8-oxo-dGTP diphosphatase MutT [Tindallia californiensis]|uniref:8-oxo-dGTP diphosphatase n=1 Tax=Tindallia californiensis TaxID=159292 RepID=A0A1H3KBE6_9FIRM|nr:8-oxo-dGTP diphosphatase MutT [Tindallia californiensis]SDY49532.1 8-oxo-dGTP diphosphatase [Tindallia californiensis]
MIHVTAAILRNESNKILIARRPPGKNLAGYWEFPGGKIEENESPEESLKRELKEEMNITVEVGKQLGETTHTYDTFTVHLMLYETALLSGDIQLKEHDRMAWVAAEELLDYLMAPADLPMIENLINTD